jgi:hypothetical protein
MKLGVLAASALIGVASFASASLAQGDGSTSVTMGRTQQIGSMATSSRIGTSGPAPTLEGNRPAAGFMPQPTGPVRGARGEASNAPGESADIRNTLRRQ